MHEATHTKKQPSLENGCCSALNALRRYGVNGQLVVSLMWAIIQRVAIFAVASWAICVAVTMYKALFVITSHVYAASIALRLYLFRLTCRQETGAVKLRVECGEGIGEAVSYVYY